VELQVLHEPEQALGILASHPHGHIAARTQQATELARLVVVIHVQSLAVVPDLQRIGDVTPKVRALALLAMPRLDVLLDPGPVLVFQVSAPVQFPGAFRVAAAPVAAGVRFRVCFLP